MKLVISTQMPEQFEKLKVFLNKKVELINVPMIKVEPVELTKKLSDELKQAYGYDWVIFTSSRGVRHFFDLYEKSGEKKDLLKNVKFACIGEATSLELNNYGFETNYINPGKTSRDFAEHLVIEVLKETDKVLLPIGNLANIAFSEKLAQNCTTVSIVVYNTIGYKAIDLEMLKVFEKEAYDLMVFTSPSAFSNFVSITGFQPDVKNLKIASIGETTNEAIKGEGFEPLLTATKPNMKIFAEDILKFLKE